MNVELMAVNAPEYQTHTVRKGEYYVKKNREKKKEKLQRQQIVNGQGVDERSTGVF